MNHPDRENTLALLTDWKKHHVAVEKLMDGAAAYIGIEPEGPMHDTVWSLFNAYTDTLAVEIGDYFEWLNAEFSGAAQLHRAASAGTPS